MSQKNKFKIARIDEEPQKPNNKKSVFVSPYGGSNTKDDHVYPYVQYGNGGKQYQGLNGSNNRIDDDSNNREEDIRIIYSNKETKEKELKRKSDDKYSPDRIPSYYRNENFGGIRRNNIADLRGDKIDKEKANEIYRQKYGNLYKEVSNNTNSSSANTNSTRTNSTNQINDPLNIDKQNDDLYETFVVDDETSYENNTSNNNNSVNNNDVNNNDVNNNDVNNNNVNNNSVNNNLSNNNVRFVRVSNEPDTNKTSNDTTKINTTTNNTVNNTNRINTNNSNVTIVPPSNKRKNAKYVFPPLEILSRNGMVSRSSTSDINYQINTINRTLEDFKIGGKVIKYTKGPTVTQFEVKLDPGVNVNKISGICKNLQMNLESSSIRLETPIPGKSTVGIEAPNVVKDFVLFGDLIDNESFRNDGKPLNVVLGLSISGKPIYADIADMPHGLIAGATNSGKTVCIYSIIASMLYKASPEDVKMILIDPKRNELIYFEDIPHLATPIIDDPKLATASLKWAVDEMERRYDFLKANRKRTISDYNNYAVTQGLPKIPFIVIIIDEFADLMNTASDTFETNVQRLTQKARSAGIHLLIATQRPSTDVIKGTIKANIPTRIALAVQTTVDSITILDHVGADKLLGKGDMLFYRGNNDIRVQGAYISSNELEALSQYFLEQNVAPNFMFTHDDIRKEAETSDNGTIDPLDDDLLDEVARFVFRQRKASANQIQTTYEIGFNRANKIIVALASLGIVTSENIPGKAREVLIKDIDELEQILRDR